MTKFPLSANEELSKKLQEIRAHLHANPELSFQETNTAKFISHCLTEWNIEHQTHIAGNGIMGCVFSGKQGPVIGLRADMDALPIHELNISPYTSNKPGIMHACGHDVHMTCLLGALYLLNQNKHLWKGTLKFIFQPAEEVLPGGAVAMIDAGALINPSPNILIALHVYPELPVGNVGFRPGAYMASTDELHVSIHGTGGHAALPHKLTNPVLAAAELILRWNQIPSQAPEAVQSVLSVGRIEALGATNVIPPLATLKGTFRTIHEDWRNEAHQIIERYTHEVAQKHKVEINLEIKKGYPSLHNHPEFTKRAETYCQKWMDNQQVHPLEIRMTAEDFAWYGAHLPIVFFRLGTAGPENAYAFPVHHPKFDVDPKSIPLGASILASLAVQFSSDLPSS